MPFDHFALSPQRAFTPYGADRLPSGFRYPAGFLQHADAMLYPLQFQWWFIDAQTDAGKLDWDLRKNGPSTGAGLPAGIDPVPFARDGELAAYFDGTDVSGDPPVFIVHLPDRVRLARYDDFESWLQDAKRKSGIGEPPYDKIRANPSYPTAADQLDGHVFCPNCFEANQPSRAYDEAVRCKNCRTVFNLR